MLLGPGAQLFPSHSSPPFAQASEDGGLGWIGVGDWRKVPLLERLGGRGFLFSFCLGFVFVFCLFLFCCSIVFGVVLVFVFKVSSVVCFFCVFVCFVCFVCLCWSVFVVFVFSCCVFWGLLLFCSLCRWSGLGVVLVLSLFH